MKYLKTHEDWKSERIEQKKLTNIIGEWVKSKGLDSVDISQSNIRSPGPWTEWVHKKIIISADNYLFVLCTQEPDYPNELTSHVLEGETVETLNKILNYLKSLSEDEIDRQRMEQESEKFNM